MRLKNVLVPSATVILQTGPTPEYTKAGMSNSIYLQGHMGHVRDNMRVTCVHCHERCTQNMIKIITSIIEYCYRNIGHFVAFRNIK